MSELVDDDLEWYLREVTIQAESMRLAVADFNAALQSGAGTIRIVGSAQAIINAAMAVTRLLWPRPASRDREGNPLAGQAERQRQWTLARGRALRKLFGKINEETSPLGSRRVRNSFEHFDEYLDGFLFDIKEGRRPSNIFDMNVGPRDRMIIVDGQIPTHLRFVDNESFEVSVLDESMPIQPLVDEVQRIDSKAREWLDARETKRRGRVL